MVKTSLFTTASIMTAASLAAISLLPSAFAVSVPVVPPTPSVIGCPPGEHLVFVGIPGRGTIFCLPIGEDLSDFLIGGPG